MPRAEPDRPPRQQRICGDAGAVQSSYAGVLMLVPTPNAAIAQDIRLTEMLIAGRCRWSGGDPGPDCVVGEIDAPTEIHDNVLELFQQSARLGFRCEARASFQRTGSRPSCRVGSAFDRA